MKEIEVFDNNQQETYRSIRNSVIAAQGRVYSAVNSAMVLFSSLFLLHICVVKYMGSC